MAVSLLCLPPAAAARRTLHRFRGVETRGALVFHLHGLRHARITGGRLVLHGRSIRIRLSALRRAARRGILRAHLRRLHRRSLRVARVTAVRPAVLIIATASRRPPQSPPEVLPAQAPAPGISLPVVPVSALYVSPSGSDSNPGTLAAPWRTLAHASTTAPAGSTVVLEAGTYGARGQRTNWTAAGTATAPITFIGDPTGPRPTILGYNVLYGSHVRVWNVLFDGPTGPVDTPTTSNPGGEDVVLWLTAPDIQINDSEIRNSHWHAGIYVTNGDGDKLLGNYIHDNGDFSDPTQANLDHGIYWDSGTGGLIADNLIVHNLAMGIQLYPDATNVNVEWNTIAANGKSGVIIAENAAGNTIQHNIVAANTDNSIRSWSLTGTGNTAHDNIVWNNGSGNLGTDATGLTLTNNPQTNPLFLAPGNYNLQPTSPALGVAGANMSGLASF